MDLMEEIKARLNIEDVIGEYVHLKRAGRNFKGLSPFSNEKTPSFMVSPDKQIWHDFSSGKGGNMFSFVMEMEGLDFKAALEHLARKAGLDISQFKRGGSDTRDKLKKRLYEANELAAKFYQAQFKKNTPAMEYVFKARRFNKSSALNFRLGWAPAGPDALHRFLLTRGFNNDELQAGGLLTRSRQPVDMFRSRLMIPLCDPVGQIIGFTARLLDKHPPGGGDAPKYINTPGTLLYDKSRHVFGLHLAKEAIRKTKFVVIVEGNLDVIASHQASINNVVATAGTAATAMHLKSLARFSQDIRLAFDQDSAGLNAAERVIPLAAQTGVNLSVIKIVGAKDPDELIKQDFNKWQVVITKPVYALDWLMEHYQIQMDIGSAVGKKQFSAALLAVINKLNDPIEQEHYLAKLAKLIDVSRETLKAKLSGTPTKPLRRNAVQPAASLQTDNLKAQNRLLALALLRPALRDFLKPVSPAMLALEPAQKLLDLLKTNGDSKLPRLKEVAEYSKLLELQFEELYSGIDDHELEFEARRLRSRLIEQYVKNRKTELAEQLKTADDPKTNQLLNEAKKLDELLKAKGD